MPNMDEQQRRIRIFQGDPYLQHLNWLEARIHELSIPVCLVVRGEDIVNLLEEEAQKSIDKIRQARKEYIEGYYFDLITWEIIQS